MHQTNGGVFLNARLLTEKPCEAHLQLAINQACLESVQEGASPLIRVYYPSKSVSLGCFQCLTDEISVSEARQEAIDIIRRVTGGGAFYHEQEVCYTVIAPEKFFSEDVKKSYGQLTKPVMQALASLGIQTQFHPMDNLVLDGAKVGWCAQAREQGVVLHEGGVLVSANQQAMTRYLLQHRNDGLPVRGVSEKGVSEEQLLSAVRKQLQKTYNATKKSLTAKELARAQELAMTYSDESWIGMR